jgi:hypothetical protein
VLIGGAHCKPRIWDLERLPPGFGQSEKFLATLPAGLHQKI